MAEELHNGSHNSYDGKGLKGALWTLAGTSIGALATNVINNGGIGNLFGGVGNCIHNDYVTQRDAQKDARIAELETDNKFLKSNTYTDTKILEVYKDLRGEIRNLEASINAQAVVNANVTATLNCQAGQIASLLSLTKLIVPSGSICPPPMPQYNSWTAPTAAA